MGVSLLYLSVNVFLVGMWVAFKGCTITLSSMEPLPGFPTCCPVFWGEVSVLDGISGCYGVWGRAVEPGRNYTANARLSVCANC